MTSQLIQIPEEEYMPGSLPSVFGQIEDLARKLAHVKSLTLRQANLTPPQFFILTALWQSDGRPLKELAGLLGCTPATLTGVVDTLERKGLVAREANPADRRSLLLRLTAAGRDFRQSVPDLQGSFGCCCSGLSPQETRQLGLLLGKLSASFGCLEGMK
jgi:DNA-binding MarR family transcriptional regulator